MEALYGKLNKQSPIAFVGLSLIKFDLKISL
jgi:hypothetical protein